MRRFLFAFASLAALGLSAAAPAPAREPAAPAPVPAKPVQSSPPAATPAPAQPAGPSVEDAVPDAKGVKRLAVLRGLNKVTGRAIDILAPAGKPVRFGTLTITVRYCYTVPPEEPPETSAFLQIDDTTKGKTERKFSGWMFASTPALNGLEHPVYDVWVITCKTDQPETPPAADAATPAGPPTPIPANPPSESPPPAAPPPAAAGAAGLPAPGLPRR